MDEKPKSRRGGARPGAGRKPKQRGTASQLSEMDIRAALDADVPDDVETAAQAHAGLALESLRRLLCYSPSEPARIIAAKEVLDRGWGRPSIAAPGDPLLPFLGTAPVRVAATDVRDQARKLTNLAIEVLRRIAEHGAKQGAKALASKALLERGLGTVAVAKVPDDLAGLRKLGKKEQAERAAEAAGTGLYATPAPPKVASRLN